MEYFGGNMMEVGIREMFNFHNNQATGSLRPVTSHIYVRFFKTSVQLVLGDDWSIPLNKFEFLHLRDLSNYVEAHIIDGPPHTIIGI